jgi:hypothetical protein
MEKRFAIILLTLVFTVAAGIAAQSRDFFPYVSHIRAESRNNLIRLTWVDSPDALGPVYIFRSARPFSGSIPANIRPVVVGYGEQYYIDDSDDMENVYYFIAASEVSGQRYDIIIPQINSTSASLSRTAPNGGTSSDAETSPAGRAAEPMHGIYNLRAVRDGERVIVTYDSAEPRRNVILYRSMQPVRRPQDLLNAIIVQSGISSPFFDFPVHGITWYYAVIYEDEVSGGNVGIRPGSNATTSAVIISAAGTAEYSLRPIPLPFLTLRSALPEGYFFARTPDEIPLSADSANMLRNSQIPQKAPLVLKNPRVFVVDLEAPSGGEESALFQIVMESFVKFEWESARISLQHYLSLPRSRDAEVRARFYLGQTLYYTGNYREALIEFLSFRSLFQAEANSWIEAVLTAMVY